MIVLFIFLWRHLVACDPRFRRRRKRRRSRPARTSCNSAPACVSAAGPRLSFSLSVAALSLCRPRFHLLLFACLFRRRRIDRRILARPPPRTSSARAPPPEEVEEEEEEEEVVIGGRWPSVRNATKKHEPCVWVGSSPNTNRWKKFGVLVSHWLPRPTLMVALDSKPGSTRLETR